MAAVYLLQNSKIRMSLVNQNSLIFKIAELLVFFIWKVYTFIQLYSGDPDAVDQLQSQKMYKI